MSLKAPPAAALTLMLALLATGCTSESTADPDSGRLQVASTVAPITSIVANIGGDRIDLTGIVPEGTNSHTFEPPPQVSALMERADVVFVNGLQLEEPTFALAEANAPEDAVLVELGDEVLPESDYLYDFSFPGEDGSPTRTCGPTPPTPSPTPASSATSWSSATEPTPTTTRPTTTPSWPRRASCLTRCAPIRQASRRTSDCC